MPNFKNTSFLKFVPWLIVIFAAVLRVPLLNGSFWLDEAAQALESSRALSQQLNIVNDFQPPLLHYIVHFSLYFSSSEWWLRSIGALLPGLITIFFTYKIGELLWSKRVAVIASLLLSTSSFHIFFSQELRQYSLPAAIATVSWYLLFLIWKSNSKKTNLIQLSLLALTTGLGLYSSYLYPFLLLAQIGFALYFLRSKILAWGSALAIGSASFLLIFPLFLQQLAEGSTLRTTLPGWENVVSFTQLKVLPLVFAKFLFGVSNVEINLFYVVSSLTFLVLLLILFRKYYKVVGSDKRLTILIWLIIPIFLSFLVSYFVPVLQPKRVLYSLPAFYLFLASLTNFKKSLAQQITAVTLIGLVLALNLISTFQYWSNPDLQRENWRGLIQEIETKYPDKTAALFAFPEPFAPWVWYADKNYPTFTSKTVLTDSNPNLADDIKKINQYEHVLLFEYLTDLTDPNNELENILESYEYQNQGYFMYPNIGHVWIYSKPSAVISYRYR